jgi:hypothetical protein
VVRKAIVLAHHTFEDFQIGRPPSVVLVGLALYVRAGVPLENMATWPDLGLRGVVILADHVASGAFSADGSQTGHVPVRLRFDVRGPLEPGLVRPVRVVVDQVLAERQGQVAFADDQDPVQQFTAESSDDALADGVPCSTNTSTYNRLSSTVSTTRKSQAMIACAWAARNSRHVGPARRGAGAMPKDQRLDRNASGRSSWPAPSV